MHNILDFTLEELQNWMKDNGESAFRAKQVFSWIYKEVWNFEEMKNIPASLKEKLKENFVIQIPEIVNFGNACQRSGLNPEDWFVLVQEYVD